MGKIKTFYSYVNDESETRPDGRKVVSFKTDIKVNSKGVFYTILPSVEAKFLTSRGIRLEKRRNKTGYFESDTLSGLERILKNTFEDAVSYTLFSTEKVILYRVNTFASYCESRGEIVPNGSWVEPPERYSWKGGNSENPTGLPFGVTLFASVAAKNVYKYRNGKTVTKFEFVQPKRVPKDDPEYYLNWLASVPCERPKNVIELPYSEEVAKMFVGMIKGLIKMSKQLEFITDPVKTLDFALSSEQLKLN